MKKQVLMMAISLLALLAGLNDSYGQATSATTHSAPRGFSCDDSALNPIAGKEYTYKIETVPTTGNSITWWATQDFDFVTTDADDNQVLNNDDRALEESETQLKNVGDNYNLAQTDAKSVTITWSDAILSNTVPGATPTFVVAYVEGSCNDNLRAYEIEPIRAFTVDILNLDPTTKTPAATNPYDYKAEQCFDEVESARYDLTAREITYDYGTQVLFYEVVAANFTNYWVPQFEIAGLGVGQVAKIEWDYDPDFNSPNEETSGTLSSEKVITNQVNTDKGVSIFVRVTIENNNYEGIDTTPISLYVDGQNSAGQWDIDNGTGDLCNNTVDADKADVAIQDLTPRPEVMPTVPSTFIPGNQTNALQP